VKDSPENAMKEAETIRQGKMKDKLVSDNGRTHVQAVLI